MTILDLSARVPVVKMGLLNHFAATPQLGLSLHSEEHPSPPCDTVIAGLSVGKIEWIDEQKDLPTSVSVR
tara:strand:+ start:276 stop:485 length:210 start_codon:yes stop_codon:yes gene_type:complete